MRLVFIHPGKFSAFSNAGDQMWLKNLLAETGSECLPSNDILGITSMFLLLGA